jgi:hypothetical protein
MLPLSAPPPPLVQSMYYATRMPICKKETEEDGITGTTKAPFSKKEDNCSSKKARINTNSCDVGGESVVIWCY